MTFRPRWYGGMFNRSTGESAEPSGVVQVEDQINRRYGLHLPEHVLRLAHAEYDRQHPGQPYERMQERGGLGILEVVGLLADYVDRLGGEPSLPGHKHRRPGGNAGFDRWCNNQRCPEVGRTGAELGHLTHPQSDPPQSATDSPTFVQSASGAVPVKPSTTFVPDPGA